ncbi:MAG: OmpW family protein [Betaproteobacteria bacterium]|nr:OmpW family protein [Betaproteobacteria bacterium]
MKKTTLALLAAAVAGTFALPAAAAEPNPWMVRVRALYMETADKSEAIPSLGVAANDITVNSKWFPEVDISYFFTKNVAAELVLTYPQKHEVTVEDSVLGGPITIGTFKHLPPTLSLQYHFNPDGDFRPYVGAGVNFTFIMDDNLSIPGVGDLKLDSNSVGASYGAGFDFKLAKNTYLNVDLKKVYIGSDVKLNGAKVSSVKVDPLLWSVGLGWRF